MIKAHAQTRTNSKSANAKRPPQIDLTLVDPSSFDPAIDPVAFPNTLFLPSNSQRERFWSSTTYVALPGFVWGVDIVYGYSNYYANDFTAGARCVR